MSQFVESIDLAYSNVKCKQMYQYCRPDVKEGNSSYLRVKQLRHAIIERINTNTKYIPNDVSLDDTKHGMILYALNSCGKSSLLRSIGLCVIMAQCGMYVPCDEMELVPFESILTQVDLTDNLWKAQSSFISEMIGLRKILKMANKNTLVLSDELTKGTEVISATSIFTASVLNLVRKKCKFVFTTHLHDVAKLEEIQFNPKIRICHLSVRIENSNIIFERQLKDGPSSELYGLEVARAVGLDADVMEMSFQIRNQLIQKKTDIVETKRSKYNQQKIVNECEICGYKPVKKTDIPLDTHHIEFQCTANKHNIIKHYHKNAKFNLICLCKSCHTKVHNNQLEIRGYIHTTEGIRLQYQS
jgi:DNA mismatch repair protein MutS